MPDPSPFKLNPAFQKLDLRKDVLLQQSIDKSKLKIQPQTVFIKHDAMTAISAMNKLAFRARPVFAETVKDFRPNKILKDINGRAYFVPKLKIAEADEQGLYGLRFVRTDAGDVKLSLEFELDKQGLNDETALPLQITMTKCNLLFGAHHIETKKATVVGNYTRDLRLRMLIPIPEVQLDTIVTAFQTPNIRSEVQLVLNFYFQRQRKKKPSKSRPNVVAVPHLSHFSKAQFNPKLFMPTVQIDPKKGVGNKRKVTPPKPTSKLPKQIGRLRQIKTGQMTPAMKSKHILAERLKAQSFKPALSLKDHSFMSKEVLKALKDKKLEEHKVVAQNEKMEIVNIDDEVHLKTTILITEDDPNFDIVFGDVQPEPSEALRQIWQPMEFGTFAPGLYPNTIYMVPHGLRIRFDPNTNLPDVQPTLYQTDEEQTRVRLRIGVDPWYDAARVEELRRELSLRYSNFLMPRLVRDFTSTVSLNIDTAFRDDIAIMDEIVEEELSMSAPFYLTFDLSLEFYQFVIGLLTGPVGINGSMTFKLADVSEDDTGDDTTVPVPFSLKLSELGPVPVRYEISAGDDPHGRPRNIEIINGCSHDVFYDDVMITAFTDDENSLLPMGVFYPDIDNDMPFVLPPAEGAAIVMRRPDDDDSIRLWNALDIVLAGQRVDLDPMTAMNRVQELVPPGALVWKLTLTCLALSGGALPETLTGLHAVQVEVQVKGRAAKTHTLTAANPEVEISVVPTFQEIMDNAAQAGGLEYETRTKSIFSTGETEWSESKTHTSSQAFIFPPAFE